MAANIRARRSTRRCAPPIPTRRWATIPAISDPGNGSHGTHTLDIAAGNGRAAGARPGPARDADLVFVHLSTPRLDAVGDLGDSVRLLEALDYVDTIARGRPWVVNLSVGRSAGSHDGTSPVEQGMHELLRRGPGRAIVQSAGNYRSADLAVARPPAGRRAARPELAHRPRRHDRQRDRRLVLGQGPLRGRRSARPAASAFSTVGLGDVAHIVHEGAVVGRIYHRKNDPNNGDNQVEIFLLPERAAGRLDRCACAATTSSTAASTPGSSATSPGAARNRGSTTASRPRPIRWAPSRHRRW